MIEKLRGSRNLPDALKDITGVEVSPFEDGNGSEVLNALADRIEREYIPRPRFEDGEPVQFGDYFVSKDGFGVPLASLGITYDGRYEFNYWTCGGDYYLAIEPGEAAKRPEEPDSWERIEADAKKGLSEYWGCGDAPCHECPARVEGQTPVMYYNTISCNTAKALDIIQRCKALKEA